MRIVNGLLASMSLVLSGTVAFGVSSGGTLSGLIVDGTGAPISGALVLYKSVPAIAVAANGSRTVTGPLVASGVTAAADGAFTVSGLPPGTYNLCAYGVKNTDLGSCEWGQGTTRVNIASGQTAQVTLTVTQGTLLTFEIQDPRQQIRSLEDLQPAGGGLALTGANFAIGIWAGARYLRAALVSTSGTMRRYQLAIPQSAVRLYLDTSLNAVDASSVPILARQQGATIAAGSQAEVVVNITVP